MPIKAALLATAALAPLPAVAAPALHQYADLALSPAGDRIADIESSVEANAPRASHGVIVIRSAEDGRVLQRIDPCNSCSYSDLSFGPSGDLAFLIRGRKEGTVELSLLRGGKVAALGTVKGIASEPRFSPDGRQIALLVTIGAQKEAGATQAGVRQIGEIGEHSDERRIATVPVTGGTIAPVSPPGRYVYEYQWTPDSSGFVATTALGNGDANWWVATLDTIDARTGAVRQIAKPTTQLNFPTISPDGRTVAFIGGLMSDFGSVGGDVYTVPFAGGTPRDVTPGYDGTFTSLIWGRGGLMASALVGDKATLMPVHPSSGAGKPVWSAPVSISAGDARFALSADQRWVAMVTQDYEHAPAILAGALASPRAITRDNAEFQPFVRARSINWTNENYKVQGWLLAPRNASGDKAPMVTIVHGGPAAASTPNYLWQGTYRDLIDAGYYLFFPNPRGSYGQGAAFTRANKRDFGGGDLRDILAGIDAVEKIAPVDEQRLGLMGGSYGGFMAMWTNTQTDRFKAIVSAAGLSNWISYYGTNGIDQWMIPFFDKSMYEDPEAYRSVSAITFITKAKTPTFIYVGERDIEVPPTQSVEYWKGLKAMNVPTSLVIYTDEGHGIRDPEHAADVRKRTVAWFDKYLSKGK